MKRILIYANPKCKWCLGTGRSQSIIAGLNPVCRCVTGQLHIMIVTPDYSIPDEERIDPTEAVFEVAE